MLTDLMFYAVAIPAVALYGLSKGGLAGVSLLAVPLMSLVMSPVQAAAILLPVLVVQDAVTVYIFRKTWDRQTLTYMLPGAIFGIVLGAVTAAYVIEGAIRLAVGLLAMLFCLNAWFGAWFGKWVRIQHGKQSADKAVRSHSLVTSTILATMAGYSSFVIHAGGPPYNLYTLPRIASRDLFVGTSAVFFALANAIKVPLFFGLGQLTLETFVLSTVLMPFAIAANVVGIGIVRYMPTALFYRAIYGLTFIIGLKLAGDGCQALLFAKV